MYDQRVAEPEPAPDAGQPWRPEGVTFPDGAPQAAVDRYVAVDRLEDGAATVAVAPWPVVDPATGRLAFVPETQQSVIVMPVEALTDRVQRARRDAGQLRRPIRVGDVFWVAGFDGDPAAWTGVLDVTRAGRFVAKAALFATASGAPTVDAVRAYGLEGAAIVEVAAAEPTEPAGDDELPPPPGPVAFPAV